MPIDDRLADAQSAKADAAPWFSGGPTGRTRRDLAAVPSRPRGPAQAHVYSGVSVSRFLDLGSHSKVNAALVKTDVWLLPFLNPYLLAGYIHNESESRGHVTVPSPPHATIVSAPAAMASRAKISPSPGSHVTRGRTTCPFARIHATR